MRVLGISGSLRSGSSNHALLRCVPLLAPDIALTLYDGLGMLPHFNPDLDAEPLPHEVVRLRALVRDHEALLVCSPEYVHAIPGALKNALDWLASGQEMMEKLAVVWSASPGGAEYAHAQLLEVLRTLTPRMLVSASRQITRARRAFDAAGVLIDADLRAQLGASLQELQEIFARAARGDRIGDA